MGNQKKRAENAATDIASDLLHVQALRNAKEGITYPNDTDWQREFEAEFIYEETPDQIQVINDIKKTWNQKDLWTGSFVAMLDMEKLRLP